jgi:type I restriction enzyme, S subunit
VKVKLGDYVDLLTGFPFKSALYTQNIEDVLLLRGDNIAQGRLRWDGAKRWSKTDLAAYVQFELQPGDVILAMDRPWIDAGLKWAWVRQESQKMLLVQRVARMRGVNGLQTDYLRYLIGSPAFTAHVLSIITGVNVPRISGPDIKSFVFELPSQDNQRRIAQILSAYDDLIETNTRRIAILEEMARRLFDEWFVMFKFPGHDSIDFVDSPMGPLPDRWKAGHLEDVITLQRGFDLPTGARSPGPYPVIAATGIHGTHAEANYWLRVFRLIGLACKAWDC